MMEPTRVPRRLSRSGLRALHVSLNSPVVALESLPKGPASAAVALDAEGAIVCLRSIRAGRTVFFASHEEIDSAQLALDAAVSFAESMGFLLDDDEVALRGGDAAARLWEEIGGDAVAPLADAADAEPDPECSAQPDSAPWLETLIRAALPEALSLSKFRIGAAAVGAAASDPRSRAATR